MPELPEVETIVRGLQAASGRKICSLHLRWVRTFSGDAAAGARALRGNMIVRISRRAKYLVYTLGNGSKLVQHLRMTGTMQHSPADIGLQRFERARIILDDQTALIFCDSRKFGRLAVMSAAEYGELDARLGPEPLQKSFTPVALGETLGGSRRAIKAVLLDQTRIAGIGNIYADEALFAAKIYPARQAASLSSNELRRLHAGIVSVLRAAVRKRGTTFRSYKDAGGKNGMFYAELQVYGRGKEACRRCSTKLKTIRLAQRTTTFCPRCQPESERRRVRAQPKH